jgi:MFS family permease
MAGTGIQNWGQQLTAQYTQLYATGLGADPVDLGLLNSIAAAFSSIMSVPLGWAAEKYTVRRVMLLGFALAALSAGISASAGSWLMLIPAFLIGARLVRIMPLTDIVFISATKPEHRATVMGLSRVVWGSLNIFAPITAALVVAQFGGISAQGIRPLYYIQLILTVLAFLIVAWKLQPLPRSPDRQRDSSGPRRLTFIQDYREVFQGERWLKRWMALRVVRQFGINLATPFVPLWLVSVKGANPSILGAMGTASVIMSLAFQIPAGRLADTIGRKRVFYLLRPVAYLGTILMILAPRPEFLVLVGLLGAVALGGGTGGGVGGASFTPFITLFWEAVPQEKRGRWFGIEGLMNFSTIPASIVGGILWQRGLMTEVLLIPILLEVLVVVPILVTVPDTVARSSQ